MPYGKVYLDRDAFLLHLFCLCRCPSAGISMIWWFFSVRLVMGTACCHQPEELGFPLWMWQPRLGFKELPDAEYSTSVTIWEQEVITGWMRPAD